MTTTVYQTILEDRKTARKVADSFKVTVLGTLLGEIQGRWSTLPVTTRGEEPSNAIAQKVVTEFVNALEAVLKIKNTEEGQAELSILKTYLPKPLTEEELKTIVETRLQEYSADKGHKIKFVMDYLKENYPNLYNGSAVTKLII